MKIFLDSCIVNYLVERIGSWHVSIATAMLRYPPDTWAVSDLVRMECLVGPLKSANTGLKADYEAFFRRVEILAMDPAVFDRAAELRAQFGLKTPDGVHHATAQVHGCAELWTNDARFSSVTSPVAIRSFAISTI